MKVNYKKLIIWVIILVLWIGGLNVLKYSVTQHYAKNVSTGQFDDYTDSYKVLRTQKSVENTISIIGLLGIASCVFMTTKAFKKVK